jgi:ERCC4-type nuclease
MRELLGRLGTRVLVERLTAGDYVVGERCIVERKHVVDFHDTMLHGRLWPQLGALRACTDEAYLLVEGRGLAGPVHPEAVRGALLTAAELGVTVLRSTDRVDSAAWLHRLAFRRQVRLRKRARPRYSQRPKAAAETVPEAMLSAVPGISTVTAAAILARFGSIADLTRAAPHEWHEVPGLGAKRCVALAEALGVDAES